MFRLLINLLKIFNGHKSEFISHFVRKWLIDNKIDFQMDESGNIFSFKHNNAPFLSAHMDSVQDMNDIYAGEKIIVEENKIHAPKHIMGADDLVGVYMILDLLKEGIHKFNWILSTNEEVGAIGASDFVLHNEKLIRDSLYGIVIDRKGSGDIICYDNLYGTKTFEQTLHEVSISNGFGFQPNRGVFSDANVWSDYISCTNLSCGYYNMHSIKEYINIQDMLNSKNYIKMILKSVNKQFKATEKISYNNFNFIFDNEYLDWGNSPLDLEDVCEICKSKENPIYFHSIEKMLCSNCLSYFIEEVESFYGKVY